MANEQAQHDDNNIRGLLIHTADADKEASETRQVTGESDGEGEFSIHTHITGGTITATVGSIDIDKDDDSIQIWSNTAKDGTGTKYQPLLDTDGHTQVDVLSTALPTGAATSAKQDTIIGHVDGIETLLTTIESNQLADGHNVTVDNVSIAVTAASLPLPTGAATSANQQTDALTDAELRATPVDVLSGLAVPEHDYIGISYVASGNGAGQVETVEYRTGGSGGSVVGTLTLAYDGSDRIANVTKT